MTAIVGLDLATYTGLALWVPGTDAPRLLSLRLPGDPEDLGRPLEKLRSTLADIHAVDPITHLFYEAAILPRAEVGGDGRAHMRTNLATVLKLCALAGMAEWFALRIGAHCRQVEQSKWRKHFFGKGTGRSKELKAAAMDAARLRGWMPLNDHEADAAGVLDYGLHCFGIVTPWRDAHLFGGRVAA